MPGGEELAKGADGGGPGGGGRFIEDLLRQVVSFNFLNPRGSKCYRILLILVRVYMLL